MRILESANDLSGEAMVLRRVYDAPPARIYRAWIDERELSKWFTPNADWPAKVTGMDLRVMGGFTAAFGAPGETPWVERVQFLSFDPPRRIESIGHMTRDGAFVSFTRMVVEMRAHGGGTELILREYGCDGEERADRAGGWGGTLDNLATLDA